MVVAFLLYAIWVMPGFTGTLYLGVPGEACTWTMLRIVFWIECDTLGKGKKEKSRAMWALRR